MKEKMSKLEKNVKEILNGYFDMIESQMEEMMMNQRVMNQPTPRVQQYVEQESKSTPGETMRMPSPQPVPTPIPIQRQSAEPEYLIDNVETMEIPQDLFEPQVEDDEVEFTIKMDENVVEQEGEKETYTNEEVTNEIVSQLVDNIISNTVTEFEEEIESNKSEPGSDKPEDFNFSEFINGFDKSQLVDFIKEAHQNQEEDEYLNDLISEHSGVHESEIESVVDSVRSELESELNFDDVMSNINTPKNLVSGFAFYSDDEEDFSFSIKSSDAEEKEEVEEEKEDEISQQEGEITTCLHRVQKGKKKGQFCENKRVKGKEYCKKHYHKYE
jgi:hypothetical protein